MNEQNLIPFDQRTESEQREIRSKGGAASGVSRRRTASLKTAAKEYFKANPNAPVSIIAALAERAETTGDPKAVDKLMDLLGETVQREELALKKKQLAGRKKPADTLYSGIPAALVAPAFSSVLFDISDHAHSEYVFPGGRGSTKSSFTALEVVDLLMKHKEMHACILRQVGNTLKDSVYNKIEWAVTQLGLENEFTFTKSPLEITRTKTGQKLYFRGADDENKIKSIAPPFGYIGILWFEELDQFRGEEAVRKIEQSVLRGGDVTFEFKTFNPPKSANNWANLYLKTPRADRLAVFSDYRSVPQKWLGKRFLNDAEFLKETNPIAYANEYLGEANGTGGNVFDNVEICEISDTEILQFDNLLNGVDWGWYPDLFAFVRCHYDAGRHTLYIWQEYTCNKQSNEQTAAALRKLGITDTDLITCDSAEQKSVSDYRAFGLSARAAEKGPGSREYSFKWLQSLAKIVIDPKRCPAAAKEFLEYEYDRDRDGNVISGYPDGNDHVIDAVRYAANRIWKRKGQ